jgi:hypothetical protein
MFCRHEITAYYIFISLNHKFLLLKLCCYQSNNLETRLEKESKKFGRKLYVWQD